MKLSLCNEVLREFEFARQCAVAAELGYAGLEVAPFTLGDDAYRMSAAAARADCGAPRRTPASRSAACTGCWWRRRGCRSPAPTARFARARSTSCSAWSSSAPSSADDYLVHGSPAQRRVGGEADPEEAAARAEAAWAAVGAEAAEAGVVYCIEPLARPEADFVNTLAEAAAIVAAHRLRRRCAP